MSLSLLLTLSGGLEAVGGVVTLIVPVLVTEILLGGPSDVVAIVLARFFGAGMFALGLACLTARRHSNSPAGLAIVYSITSYNLVATALLIWAHASAGLGGVVLLSAAIMHAAFGFMLVRAFIVLAKVRSRGGE